MEEINWFAGYQEKNKDSSAVESSKSNGDDILVKYLLEKDKHKHLTEEDYVSQSFLKKEQNDKAEGYIDKKYRLVKAEIKKFDVVSISTIQRYFDVGYAIGNIIIQRLLADELIEPSPEEYKYDVVK